MCDTSGSQLGPTYYFPTRTHITPKWVPCLHESGVAHIGPIWAAQLGPTTFYLSGPLGAIMGIPTWAFPCWYHLGPIFIFTWVQPGYSHLGIPMLVPIGTHIFFHMGYTWALPLGQPHVGPIWDPSLFSYGIQLGSPNWAFPCWSQLGPIFFFIQDTLRHSNSSIPMLIPIGTHIFFHMGYTWARPLGHSHVCPTWDPHLFFMWDTPGHSHSGIPMLVQHGTHIYFIFHCFYLARHMFPSGHSCCYSKWFTANKNEKIHGVYMV